MAFSYYFFRLWEWFVAHGIPLIALTLVAILIPRIGRLTIRIVANRGHAGAEAKKARLALVGAMVYVVQIVAYFIVILLALTNLGVPAMSAALPATVVSAAVGFGAQKVIQDFLAGFFIISEHQFGVGDYVSFDGTSGDIEGTVVALTLRATRIRTPSGEVVTVPNGSAGVITNFSQDWSRAVVDLAIPLQSGESMDDLLERVNHTASEAIHDPSIKDDVIGEVEILPATKLVAPTAAGQSWQVNFRTMVVVNPARQWAVERVIRSALLNVFWDRYDLPSAFAQADFGDAQTIASPGASEGTKTGSAGSKHDSVKPNQQDVSSDAPTQVFQRADQTSKSTGSADSGKSSAAMGAAAGAAGVAAAAAGAKADSKSDVKAGSSTRASAGADAQDKPAEDAAAVESAPDKDDGPGSPSDVTAPVDATDATASTDSTNSNDSTDDDDIWNGVWRGDTYDSKFKNALSIGGRIRPSTTGLILGLILTGGLALASSNPEGASAGVLSPDHWRNDKPAATQEHKPSEASTTPEPTSEQAPATQTPTDTSGTQQPSNVQQPQQTTSPTTSQQQPQQDEPTQQQGSQRQPNAAGRGNGGAQTGTGSAQPSSAASQTSWP